MSNSKYYIKLLAVQILILIFSNFLAHGTEKCIRDSIGMLTFEKSKSKLSALNKGKLDSLLTVIKIHSECAILVISDSKVICHGNTKANQIKFDRWQTITDYFVKNGVPRSRLIFRLGPAQENTIELYLDNFDEFQTPLPPTLPLQNVRK